MGTTFSQLIGVSQSSINLNMLGLDSISNNLANINSNGFKSSRLDFQELLKDQQLNGATLANQQTSMLQGAIKTTAKELDLAIQGNGFFAVTLPDGAVAYTRDGSFHRDADGTIVDDMGNPLVWNGSLPIDAMNVEVTEGGEVVYHDPADEELHIAGTIQLHRFMNPSGLEALGDNNWAETESSGPAEAGDPTTEGYGMISDYSLEVSNVNMAEEFTSLVLVQRSFEVAVRALQQSDEMMGLAVNMRQA